MNIYRETVPYILTWYDYNARILPWRSDPTPYHVWLSEIMLQQTRVEAVKDYYERFLSELPTIYDLAGVSEERLLKLWEGLGYYSRARNLKKAAELVVSRYNGELPADFGELRALPGIGNYTAGAILSIAFRKPEPAVDGNLLRVFSRITGSTEDILKASVREELRKNLRSVMPEDRPGDFNQGLMDLGATVCIPNGKPHCDICPVMHLCRAFHEGRTEELPVKGEKAGRTVCRYTVFVITDGERYLLMKRPEKGLLGGLWGFPMASGGAVRENAGERIPAEIPVVPGKVTALKPAKHIFSHVEWHMSGFRIEAKETGSLPENFVWASAEEIRDRYSVPAAYRAFMPKEGRNEG